MTDQTEQTPEQSTEVPVEETEAQAATQPPTLEEQLEQAKLELAQAEDKYLRLQAELVNFRRRKQDELDEFRKYQGLNIVRDLLGPIDNLQRAVTAAEQGSSIEDLKLGVKMVAQQIIDTLGNYSIHRMTPVGAPFDPNVHEALQQEESVELPPMTVLRELEAGFKMHDRVIRPAKVVVSKAAETSQQETATQDETTSDGAAESDN